MAASVTCTPSAASASTIFLIRSRRRSARKSSKSRSDGAVATVKEAFDRYLGEGQPAYVQRYRLEAADAVALVRGAGGTVTIAHPGVSKLEVGEVARLAAAGVVGIEVIHPDQNPSVREKYQRAAEAHGLVCTAGSDFHGPDISPDRHLGMVSMSPEALASLERRRP